MLTVSDDNEFHRNIECIKNDYLNALILDDLHQMARLWEQVHVLEKDKAANS